MVAHVNDINESSSKGTTHHNHSIQNTVHNSLSWVVVVEHTPLSTWALFSLIIFLDQEFYDLGSARESNQVPRIAVPTVVRVVSCMMN